MAGLHNVETYERADGKRGWRVRSGDDIVATDGGQGYNNEEDCLAGFFGCFFGEWDMTFLELYQKWQQYDGQSSKYTIPPEAMEGPPVRVREDADAPNYQADDETPAEAAESVVQEPDTAE